MFKIRKQIPSLASVTCVVGCPLSIFFLLRHSSVAPVELAEIRALRATLRIRLVRRGDCDPNSNSKKQCAPELGRIAASCVTRGSCQIFLAGPIRSTHGWRLKGIQSSIRVLAGLVCTAYLHQLLLTCRSSTQPATVMCRFCCLATGPALVSQQICFEGATPQCCWSVMLPTMVLFLACSALYAVLAALCTAMPGPNSTAFWAKVSPASAAGVKIL